MGIEPMSEAWDRYVRPRAAAGTAKRGAWNQTGEITAMGSI